MERSELLIGSCRPVGPWVEAAKGQMRGDSGSVECGFSLGPTDQVARNLGRRNSAALQPDELANLRLKSLFLDGKQWIDRKS